MNIIRYKQMSAWTIIPTVTVRHYANCVHIGFEFLNCYFGISLDLTHPPQKEQE